MKNLFYLLALVWMASSAHAQTTHTVDNTQNSGADFTSVQDAINAAAIGDTIYIHPSPNNYGHITINKTLHIRGMGHSPEYSNGVNATLNNITLNSPIGAQGITISGIRFVLLEVGNNQNYSNLTLSNCRVNRILGSTTPNATNNWIITGNFIDTNGLNRVYKYNVNGGWMVMNNHIRQAATAATWATFGEFNASDTFRNNIVVSNQNEGNSTVFTLSGGLVAENNIFIFHGNSTGMSATGVTFNHNLTFSVPGQTLSDLNGSNNLNNMNPEFVDIGSDYYYDYTKDFNLQPSSPAVGAGTGGDDLGIYGSDFNFNMLGYPDDLPYPTLMQVSNSVVQNGGTLNVTLEAVGN